MHTLARLSILSLLLAGCSSSSSTSTPHHYVLVHGAFQGAWAWSEVASELRARGHEVDTVELPAHGDDTGTLADASMPAYVARVVAALDDASEPVVLVGHSMGGLVISGAAEARPDRVSRLVYVAAYLPRSGDSLLSLASTDAGSTLGAALLDDGSDGTLDVRTDALVGIFCADCDEGAQAELLARYRTEPALPLTQAITLSEAAFGRVARAYLHATDDRAVSRELQGRMVAASPVVESAELATGHSPFLSRPVETADALETLAD